MKNTLFLKLVLGFGLSLSISSSVFAKKSPKEEKACAKGNLDACADLGNLYMRGKIGSRWDYEANEEIAKTILLDACDGGRAKACSFMGVFYIDIDPNPNLAVKYLEQACEQQRASSCFNLAYLYSKDKYNIIDYAKAAELNQKACKLDSKSYACMELAFAYSKGRGVNQDQFKAANLLENSCESGQKVACNEIAARYASGKGVEVDFAKAAALYKPNCSHGFAMSCRRLGQLYETGGDKLSSNKKRAIKYYKKACKIDSPRSCHKVRELSK